MKTPFKQPNKDSRYEPIWETLKAKGICKITAPQVLHARIIKAVKKRKDLDTVYKLSVAERRCYARLSTSTDNTIITFKLITATTISEL